MAQLLANPSLYLSHLPLSHRKGVTMPAIAYDPEHDCGGFYIRPVNERYRLTDIEADASKGLLVLCRGNEGSALTHEFRHHLQSVDLGYEGEGTAWRHTGDYRSDIVRYFMGDPAEMDALRYEYKYARDDINSEWVEWLMDHRA